MARMQRTDQMVRIRLDEIETSMFQLKVLYEKYFSGIEKLEPAREREVLRRQMRDLSAEVVRGTAQTFRLSNLKARFITMDLYITRNLVQIERGTHPKFRFRADLADRARGVGAPAPSLPPPRIDPAEESRRREDEAYRAVYDRYMEARRSCGQQGEISYDSLRDTLRKQVGTIRERYQCDSVRFRVLVEDGQARLKAVPMRATPSQAAPSPDAPPESGGGNE